MSIADAIAMDQLQTVFFSMYNEVVRHSKQKPRSRLEYARVTVAEYIVNGQNHRLAAEFEYTAYA